MTAPKNILTHTVDIAVDDGTTMGGYVARPAEPGPHPGVVVAMELFGLSAHVRGVCERLATLGFVAVAPDLYHRTAPGTELAEDAAGRERGFELLRQQTREQVLSDIAAAIDRLRADGSTAVGMVGLSVGGHVAYLAATEFDLPAVAVVYGGWLPTTDIPLGRPEPTLARTAKITGRLLILVGEDDQVVPEEHRREIAQALRAAGVRHEIIEYPGVAHGFLSNRRATYNTEAAHDAWQRVQDLLTAELPQVVIEALSTHVTEHGTGPGGLLFTLDGLPVRRASFFQRVWRPALKAAGLPADTHFHSMRHYYASLLIRHGESVKTVQARLGHASATETLDTYSHLWPDSDDRTREAVDSVLLADYPRTDAAG